MFVSRDHGQVILRQLDNPFATEPFPGLPLEKQKRYAHRVRSQRPARFRKLQEPRQTLDTVSFLRVTLLQLTDTVIELGGRLILDTVGRAKRRATIFAAERSRSYKNIVEEIKQVAMDPALSDQAARARIVELCNRPSGVTFPSHAATVRHLLSESGTPIRSLLAELTRLDLHATNDDTLTAVRALKEIYANKKTLLPKLGDYPCPRPWRTIIEGEDRAKALRGLEGGTLLELRRGLKRGSVLAHVTALDAAGIALMMPQVTAEQVLSAMRYVEEEGALKAANQTVVAFQRRYPITKAWGDGTLASADLTSLDVSKHLWNARRDPRRRQPAIGSYTHLGDFWSLFNDMPLLLHERQAGAGIEGAIRQKDIPVATLCVDTHGYSEFAMAIAKLLGLDLCPRLKRLQERKLFVPNKGIVIPGELKDVIDFDVSLRAIIKEWDTLVRITASIETGETSALVAIAHFGSVARGDPVHTAGVHLGRLVRSLFLCDYLTNEVFRRTIHRILAYGESVHTLQRAIHDGTPSKPRGRRPEELMATSGALTLLTNLCLTWNTMHMQRVFNDWRAANPQVATGDWLNHISPAHSGHINTRGIFTFPVEQYRERLFQKQAVNARASAFQHS